MFWGSHGAIDGMEYLSKGEIIWWQGNDMMVETMVMEEIHDIVKGGGNVQRCGRNMICVWFKGTQVDLG